MRHRFLPGRPASSWRNRFLEIGREARPAASPRGERAAASLRPGFQVPAAGRVRTRAVATATA